jgi:hypothetical protein
MKFQILIERKIMRKYPELDYKLIKRCIDRINTLDFDTYNFIDTLNIEDRAFFNKVSGIGDGWRSVIGRNLSKYASDMHIIRKKKERKGNAQLWRKN